MAFHKDLLSFFPWYKNEKDSSTGSDWQENPTLGVFLGWDAETSSAGLDD